MPLNSLKLNGWQYASTLTLAIFLILLDHWFKVLSFSAYYQLNRGIAFSLPLASLWLIASIILALFIFSIGIFNKDKIASLLSITISLAACSNFYDRLKYGGVVDYINFINISYLNIADLIISTATLLLIIKLFFYQEREII